MCNAVRHQFLILFILFPLFTDNLRNTRFLFFSLCFFSSLNLYFHLIPFFLYLKSCLSLDISRFLFFRVYSLFRPFIFPLASLLFFFFFFLSLQRLTLCSYRFQQSCVSIYCLGASSLLLLDFPASFDKTRIYFHSTSRYFCQCLYPRRISALATCVPWNVS